MNNVHIQPTIFTNPRFAPESLSHQSFGWRAWDDYSQTYYNAWHDGIPDDDKEFLKKVLVSDDACLWAMLEFCEEEQKGIHIGDTYYPWNDIEEIVHNAKH